MSHIAPLRRATHRNATQRLFTGDIMNSRPLFELSDDVRVVLAIMAESKPGDVLTYDEVSGLVKYDIRSRRHVLSSAFRVALRERNEVWASVTNVGIKLLANDERAKLGSVSRRRIRREASRAVRKLSTVDLQALSESDRDRCVYDRAVFGAVCAMSTESTAKHLRAKAKDTKIALAETIEMFKDAG